MSNTEEFEARASSWIKIFNELSYCGSRKPQIYHGFDIRFGVGNWEPAHFIGGLTLSRSEGYKVYEEAYYQFLKQNLEVRRRIVQGASEVYDIEPSNIDSGLDYEKQECVATHLQDIAVRRALIRLKLEEKMAGYNSDRLPKIPIFEGSHPIQIRGHETEGFYLNPGQVPFHRKDLILDTEQKGWWNPGSVEDWYQKNKVLLVDPNNFLCELVFISPTVKYFAQDNEHFYQARGKVEETSLSLRMTHPKAARRNYAEGLSAGIAEIFESPRASYTEWANLLRGTKAPDKRTIKFGDLKHGR